MLRKLFLLIAAASLALGLGGGCEKDKPTEIQRFRDVAGRVTCTTNESNYAVDNAKVTIAGKNDVTDSDGFFLIAEVPYGEHQLRVEKTGYVISEQPVAINEETPSPLSVAVAEDENLMVFGEEIIPLDFILNGNNQSDVVQPPLKNATIESFTERVFGESGQSILSGSAKVIKLSDKLDAKVMTVLGKTIKLSSGLSVAAFVWRLKNNEGNFFETGEKLEVVYEVKMRTPGGYDRIFIIQPTSIPAIAMGRTMTDSERRIFQESDYELRAVVTNPQTFEESLEGLLDKAALTCTFYSTAVFVIGLTGNPQVVLACAGVGGLQIVKGVGDVVLPLFLTEEKIGIYCRKWNFQGAVTDPFICITPIPKPKPAPLSRLLVYPASASVKLGHLIQFTATAYDQTGSAYDMTDGGAAWSVQGVAGYVNNGLFQSTTAGRGFVVASLKPTWDLEARAEVAVLPANGSPECDIISVGPVVDPCKKTYSIECWVKDPDGNELQTVHLDYGDGTSEDVSPDGLNAANLFTRVHCYSTRPADATLRLTATDIDGAMCVSTYPLHIPANQSPISHPVCPTDAKAGIPLTLQNEATDADGRVVYYRWSGEFGDKYTYEPSIDVTFHTPGSKVVFMYAKDNEDVWSQAATCSFEVGEICTPYLTLPCDAIFVAGQATNFCWQSTCTPDPARKYRVYVNNAFWGEVSDNMRCANLNILTPGNHVVCVELVENGTVPVRGCCTVTVEAACAQQGLTLQYPALVKVGQDITICADATCVGPGYDPVRFIFTMNGQPWRDSYQKCHTIIPSVPGKIHFCVELIDSKGNRILKCVDVDVVQDNQAPVANPGGPYSGTAGGTVTVHGTATDPDGDAITAWEWLFEGQKYLVQDAVLTLPQTPGSYPLTLKVKDSKDAWSPAASTTVGVLVASGTIEVTCNNDAGSWSISPGNYSGSGRYNSISDVPPGTYTITWYAVTGYDTPASQTKTLSPNGSVTFNGSYSTTTTPVQISGQTSMTVTVGQYFRWEWTATGGTPGWGIWFSYSGLPSGVSGKSGGFIEGPCNIIGDFIFTVTAHDAASSANTAAITCTLHVVAPQGQLAADRNYVDFGGDRTLEEVYVTNAGQGGGIQFTTRSDQAWLTVYPSIGITNTNLRLTVSRTGLNSGQYEAHVYLTSSGGDITITVKMSVGGTACSNLPTLISPRDGQEVSLSAGFDFTWTKVCESVGEYNLYVYTAPNPSGTVVFADRMSPTWTSLRYWGSNLQPGRTYYWVLQMGNYYGAPLTEWASFKTTQ